MEYLPQILISLLLGSAVFLLVWSLFRIPLPSDVPVHRRLALALGAQQRQTVFETPPLRRVMGLALLVSQRMNIQSLREFVRRHLDGSGNPGGYSVHEYLAICLMSGVAMAGISALIVFLFMGWIDPLTVLAMAAVGFGVPLYTLKGASVRRAMRISKQLPYTLDLVALMMGAGSTFTEAIQTMIRDNPEDDLNQELQIVLAEIEFGTPRAAALQNMAERIPLETLRSVVGAVNQAESMGTPLSQILKNQSDMMRMHRSVRAEKLSASASLRILIPSMLILLAVVMFVFGPMIIRYMKGELYM